MEYKRLTERRGKLVIDKCGNCENVRNPQGCTEKNCYEIMKNRLAELEDKIEQGTLIELPCKIGTMVYRVIYSDYSWGKIKIGFNIHETEFTLSIFEEMLEDKLPYIFLTKEEAEKKLKELNGND